MSEALLQEALDQLPNYTVREVFEQVGKVDPVTWCATHRRLRGVPLFYDVNHEIVKYTDPPLNLLLRHRPFLLQPLADQHPHKCYKKGRQVGVSELELVEVLWFLDTHPGTKVILTFPRDTQLKDFSVTRIGEALDETRSMRELVGTPNQVYTKRIGDSYLILRSAWESNLGEGVDADMVVLDEKDRMKEGIDIAFRESLESSEYGYLREVSTPTLPGRGVDEPFQKSCQYEWFVKCTKCGKAQQVRYPDNVIQVKDIPIGTKQLEEGTYQYQCDNSKCRGNLNRLSGEWVSRFPTRTHIAGYNMPQTIAPWINATKLMQKRIDYKYVQLWTNYCLAECAVGERVLLTDTDFDQCIAGHQLKTMRSSEWSRIIAGIDWGHFNWGVVWGVNAYNDKPYVIGFTVFEDDARDPLGSAKKMDKWLKPFDPDIIIADAGYGKDRNSYLLKHWDHKFFACVSANTRVATLDAKGSKRIRDMKVGDYTYAWDGERCVPTKVTAVHNNGRRKVVRVVCKDGSGHEKSVLCTGDHVFPLRLGGEKRADELLPGDRLVPFLRWEVMGGKYRALNTTNTSKHLEYEHRVVCPGTERVHHIDGDGLNNTLENLSGCTVSEHRVHHPLKMSEYPKFMRALRKRNKDNRELHTAQTHTPEANAKRIDTRRKRGWYKKNRKRNHVVVRVEPAGTTSVWDLTVEHEAHNFALADGVFVHNCYYNPSEKHSRTFRAQFVEQSNKVLADRTIALKDACRMIKDQGVGLPEFSEAVKLIKQHFMALAPLIIEEDGEIYEIIDKTGDDHLAHAMAYCNMGYEYVTAGWKNFSSSLVG